MNKLTKKNIEDLKTGAIIVLGIIVILGIIYMISNNTGNNNYKYSTTSSSESTSSNPLLEDGEEISEEEQSDFYTITYSELEKALANNERKFIFIGSESCSWCTYQKPILRYLVYKYNAQIYYLNLSEISSEDYNSLTKLHDDLASFGTPTYIIIENGKVTTVDSGARGTQEMLSLLTTNGFADTVVSE